MFGKRSQSDSRTAVAAPSPQPAPAAAQPPSPAPPPSLVPAPPPVVSVLPEETPPRLPPRSAPARAHHASPTPPPSEVSLVEQARAALTAGDQSGALAAAARHAALYPAGVLVEEREAIRRYLRLGAADSE